MEAPARCPWGRAGTAVRWIAWLLPSAPVFEGMRAVVVEHRFDLGLLLAAWSDGFAHVGGFTVLLLAAQAVEQVAIGRRHLDALQQFLALLPIRPARQRRRAPSAGWH